MAKRSPVAKKLSPEGAALQKEGAKWLERIEAAWKREDNWSKEAEAAVKAYSNEVAGTGTRYDYNILHANTETIVPAIINSPPVPDIRRRFGDDDEVARQLANIIERAITVQVDDSRLEAELEGQAQDGFLSGRGVIRLRFHADTIETETSALAEAENAADREGATPGSKVEAEGGGAYEGPRGAEEGDEGERAAPSSVANERITFEAVSWRDYQHGPATRWEDRPWESFRHVMPCEDISSFADRTLVGHQTEPGGSLFGDFDGDHVVYEIWDRTKREVVFVSDNGTVLKRLPDPLGLSSFFPSSQPVQPLELVGRLTPITPFSIYKRLADELDVITKRIRIITAAMKIKGAFVGAIGVDLKAFAEGDDNDLIALSNIEGLAQLGGIEKAIAWWPVEKFYPILAELFKNRDLTKQAIYEITGISDIVRGASKASETFGAQQIKSQWGSLRIQKMQRMMERSARDLFVMMSEIIPAKFSHATLERMTGVPIMIKDKDDEATVLAKQKLHQLMREKITTYYRVDVESQSTVRADLTMKKQEMSEFLAGSASFFQGMAPIVQEGGPSALEGVLEIYASATRNYDLGKSAEDALEKMIADAKAKAKEAAENPQPAPPSPDMVKAQGEAKEAEARGAAEQQRAATEAQTAQVANAERTQALQAKQANDELDRSTKAAAAQQKAKHDEKAGLIEIDIKNTELAIRRVDLAKASMELLTPPAPTTGPDGEPIEQPAAAFDPGKVEALLANIIPAPATDDHRTEVTMQMLAGIGQQQESVVLAIEKLAAALTAPKRVVFDEAGRPAGVEPVAVN